MASVTIYVAPRLGVDLRRLRARLKREGSTLSRWFAEQVKHEQKTGEK